MALMLFIYAYSFLQFHQISGALPSNLSSMEKSMLGDFHISSLQKKRKSKLSTTNKDELFEIVSKTDQQLRSVRADLRFHSNNSVSPLLNFQPDIPLWKTSDSVIPGWLKSYFEWHQKQKVLLNPSNWEQQKYLVVRCLRDDSCGGTADRLLTIPTLLKVCAKYHRLLLIYWERPAKLEEFLVPPEGGLDWTVPSWLVPSLFPPGDSDYALSLDNILRKVQQDEPPKIIRSKYQSSSYGVSYYNTHDPDLQQGPPGHGSHDEPNYQQIFAHIWRVLFTPAPAVRDLVEKQLDEWNLVPGQYATTHLRALYADSDRETKTLEFWTQNALDCASQLPNHGGVIVFLSDSPIANQMAIDYGKKHYTSDIRILSRSTEFPPLHLDKDADYVNRSASDFYDTFVDLYIMTLSACVVRGRGGYGLWGSLLSFNPACDAAHMSRTQLFGCQWDPSPKLLSKPATFPRPLFPQAMTEATGNLEEIGARKDIAKALISSNDSQLDKPKDLLKTAAATNRAPLASLVNRDVELLSHVNARQKLQTKLDMIHVKTDLPYSGDLWELSDYVPDWMKGNSYQEE